MSGRELAHRIKDVMIASGVNILRTHTWSNHPNASDLVTWYGMALNLSGWDWCDDCGNEYPEADLIRLEPGADCCSCKYCHGGIAA